MSNVMHSNMKSVESEKQLLCAVFFEQHFLSSPKCTMEKKVFGVFIDIVS